ncbi:hypothetical protein K2Z83_20020 [Oscillochloris sp. ZM17-4]|uniref:hypothetical protein n=1 Tax=Oscillochloris sp. ZM17-4 TaxID=2866714 RepID=UPI001C73A4A8|nr:hypothetical protein [Oscillochloris sp. ZM17-4]MBX0329957.1 hypothetical protein [Oscillochloris sp. ZM17-4]
MIRLADISGPFYDPQKPFRNWSSFPFTQIDTPEPPYVDQGQLDHGVGRACAQLEALRDQGYTGVVIDNMAHLVTFDRAPQAVYAADSPFRLRALAYRAAFARLFARAAALGMEVYVTTDMQWSTPPLRRAAGELRADSPRLAELNRLAVDELLAAMPEVAGLVVRVGEAGGAHNQGGDYCGHMLYTSATAMRGLIATLLPVCEARGRRLIVRTWSVGIGDLGDLICSPQRYAEVFGDMRSPNLLVSVKHGPADFFRLMPHNPTLGLPGPRQIVELQNRREYELFGMVPSSVAELHRAALARAAADPQCAGVWAWNATGGWGGGSAALGEGGWSLWTELSSALTAALAQDVALDTDAFVRGWLGGRGWGSSSPQPPAPSPWAEALADLYLESAELIERGWYMGRLPGAAGSLGGIQLSPLLWVWWVRPTAALPIWAYLADAVGDIGAAVRGSAEAAARAAAHAQRLERLAPQGDGRAAELVDSARYLAGALEVAHAARALMLPLMGAAWRADRPPVAELRAAAGHALARLQAHRDAWAGREDLPPIEVAELAQFARALERSPRWVWLQARATCAAVRRLRAMPAGGGGAGIALGPAGARVMSAALPWLSQRLNLLPSIFFEAGPSIGEWAQPKPTRPPADPARRPGAPPATPSAGAAPRTTGGHRPPSRPPG